MHRRLPTRCTARSPSTAPATCPSPPGPGMRERTVTVDSMGKTFSVTGWKIGWAIAAPALTAAIRGVHQFVTFCNATPFQEAAAVALDTAHATGYFDRAARRLRRPPRPPDAASSHERRPADAADRRAPTSCWRTSPTWPLRRRRRLLPPPDHRGGRRRHSALGVLRRPAPAPRLARFCFAKSDATMAAAAERLRRLSPG